MYTTVKRDLKITLFCAKQYYMFQFSQFCPQTDFLCLLSCSGLYFAASFWYIVSYFLNNERNNVTLSNLGNFPALPIAFLIWKWSFSHRNSIKGELERYEIFHFELRAYSFYMYIPQLLNFEIMKRKMGITELNFVPELWFWMFLTSFWKTFICTNFLLSKSFVRKYFSWTKAKDIWEYSIEENI